MSAFINASELCQLLKVKPEDIEGLIAAGAIPPFSTLSLLLDDDPHWDSDQVLEHWDAYQAALEERSTQNALH
jgi:hypothetical protein